MLPAFSAGSLPVSVSSFPIAANPPRDSNRCVQQTARRMTTHFSPSRSARRRVQKGPLRHEDIDCVLYGRRYVFVDTAGFVALWDAGGCLSAALLVLARK